RKGIRGGAQRRRAIAGRHWTWRAPVPIDRLLRMKDRELVDALAIRAQPVDGRGIISIAEREPAEQHELCGRAEEALHLLVPGGPGLLRAALEPALAREQHQALDEHA